MPLTNLNTLLLLLLLLCIYIAQELLERIAMRFTIISIDTNKYK